MTANTLLKSRLPLLLVALLWAAQISAGAHDTHPGRSEKAGQLELVVETDRSQLELGEPVYLTARLRNTGNSWVTVNPVLSPQAHTVTVHLADGREGPRRFLPLFFADLTVPEQRLGPGDEIAAVFPVFFGSLGWSLARPGESQVQLSAKIGGEELYSKELHLQVRDESPYAADLVDGSSASWEAGKFLMWQQGDHLTEGREMLQSLVSADGESILADYARLALGRSLARSFRDYTQDQLREPDCIGALEWLQAVRVDKLPTYSQIQHALSSATCHARLGDTGKARYFRNQAERLSAGRPEFDWIMSRVKHSRRGA